MGGGCGKVGDAENIENRGNDRTENFDGLERSGSSKQEWFVLEQL